jgi:hypothetical protein
MTYLTSTFRACELLGLRIFVTHVNSSVGKQTNNDNHNKNQEI